MKKEVRLYNVLFPVWLLWLFPQIFLIVAPANLLVDCLVLTLALMGLKHKNKWAVVKKLGLKFWCGALSPILLGWHSCCQGSYSPSFSPMCPGPTT